MFKEELIMTPIRCNCCSKELSIGGVKYIIEIKSFADFDGFIDEHPGELEEGVNDILDVVESLDEEELEQEVFEEQIFILCKECRDKFIEDPFGLKKSVYGGEEYVAKDTIH